MTFDELALTALIIIHGMNLRYAIILWRLSRADSA
jgi:hypothetical protein